jgi:hypothetical protein
MGFVIIGRVLWGIEVGVDELDGSFECLKGFEWVVIV